jgi:hypothetical protein
MRRSHHPPPISFSCYPARAREFARFGQSEDPTLETPVLAGRRMSQSARLARLPRTLLQPAVRPVGNACALPVVMRLMDRLQVRGDAGAAARTGNDVVADERVAGAWAFAAEAATCGVGGHRASECVVGAGAWPRREWMQRAASFCCACDAAHAAGKGAGSHHAVRRLPSG